MSRINAPGGPTPPPPKGNDAGRSGQAAEEAQGFERLLEEKAGGEPKSKAPSSRDRARSLAGSFRDALEGEGGRLPAGGLPPRIERGDAEQGRSRGDREHDGERGDEGPQPAMGDLAIGGQPNLADRPAIEVPRQAEVAPKSDAAARIERIAEQIVDAVEVRMDARGESQVRLDLNLGDLGAMRAEIVRDPNGNLNIRFDAASETTRDLVQRNVADLANRLEARGVPIEAIRVHSAAKSEFSWQQQRDPREERDRHRRRQNEDDED